MGMSYVWDNFRAKSILHRSHRLVSWGHVFLLSGAQFWLMLWAAAHVGGRSYPGAEVGGIQTGGVTPSGLGVAGLT